MSGSALDPKTAPVFPMAARTAMKDGQLRRNVRHATDVIQAKRARVVADAAAAESARLSEVADAADRKLLAAQQRLEG